MKSTTSIIYFARASSGTTLVLIAPDEGADEREAG